ncbi:hypothetical protein FRC10_012296 [Ceratobasidium sp. 414]|nr:hypothetical protein FRC10_012296 [Ceratobasidium sp. 414]
MPSTTVSLFTISVVVLGVFYKLWVVPVLELGGAYRTVQPRNTDRCETVEELVIHPSGLVYLACASSPWSRVDWTPAMEALNASAVRAKIAQDYIATYDPRSRTVTKLDLQGFSDPRGLNVHGMDVVPDERNPDMLWVYVVNHRPPLDPAVDASKVGADSVVEIFKARVGASWIEWVKTVEDSSVIITPNDVVGSANGQEFWFTNDHHVKVGLMRQVYMILGIKSSSVGYCHVDEGCKIAADELYASNGIVRASDGSIWVASTPGAHITVHEQQADKTLVPTEVINVGKSILASHLHESTNTRNTGMPMDNLALSDGSIIVAAFPKLFHYFSNSLKNPDIPSAASVLKISINTGNSGYFGEKYKVEKHLKIFEEDGTMLGSLATTAAVHGDILYVHGNTAKRLVVCKMPNETL